MSRAAVRRALAAKPSDWVTLPNGVDARYTEAFPKGYWTLGADLDPGDQYTAAAYRRTARAESLAAAVRAAEELAK